MVASTVSGSMHRIKTPDVAGATALAADDRLTVTDGPSVLAPLQDHLAMLLKGV
jgi:hypothetical protein